MTFPAPRWSENQWRSEFSLSTMSGFASTWLAQEDETADHIWWYMKHGHTSKGYYMPWGSEFLRTIDCITAWSMMFVRLMTFETSLFCKTMASSCLMSPSFRSPGTALGAHRTLSTSGFTERLRSHFDDQIWSLLHHIQQRAKISNASAYELEWNWTESYNLYIYNVLCLRNKIKNGVSWIHSDSVHFEVANMPNIPTHSPEIPLRRKFSFLSASVVWSSSVSAMISAASRSPQFSICISLAPLRSSAIASSFLGVVRHNQHHHHHHHHSRRSNKKRQQPSFWKDVSSRVLKIQHLYRT